MKSCQTRAEALEILLIESVQISQKTGHSFAVVGGWSPLLLNSQPLLHPGTRDVDLLFHEATTPGNLESVLKQFIAAGYIPSAKHPFQLIKLIRVGEDALAFNVDILHPDEEEKSGDTFVDHLDLDIVVGPLAAATLRMRSIVLPVSRIVFNSHIEQIQLSVCDDFGETVSTSIPVIDELGALVTKCSSVKSAKRDRDALDLYFSTAQARSRQRLVDQVRVLPAQSEKAHLALVEFLRWLKKGNDFEDRFRSATRELDHMNIRPEDAKKCIVDLLRDGGVEA